MIRLRLPTPPSVNALYYNRWTKGKKGRGKTGAYRNWLVEADCWFLMQKRELVAVSGPCELQIKLPKIRGDATNRIKAAEDYLVSRGLTGDDKMNLKVSVEIDPNLTWCEIFIKPQNGS